MTETFPSGRNFGSFLATLIEIFALASVFESVK